MTRLTRDKIGKLLGSQTIGNFSSLASLSKENDLNSNKSLLSNKKNIKLEEEKYFEQDFSKSVQDQSNTFYPSENDNKSKYINTITIPSININQNKSIPDKVLNDSNTSKFSVSDPLASESYKKNIRDLPEEFINQKIQEDHFATFINNKLNKNDFYLHNKNFSENEAICKVESKVENSNFNIFKQNESVSNSLDNNFISFNTEHNQISFNIADTLAGKGLILVMYLIDVCQKNCSLITPPIFTKDLLQVVCIKPNHLRNLILRLSEKKVFKVLLHKSSKHAVRVFEFEKNIYVSLVKRKCNMENNNNNLNKNISYGETFNVNTSEQKILSPFKNIDLSPLESLGFNETHLIQIYKEYEKNPDKALSIEILQYSIDAFAFDLKYNNIMDNFKNSPAVVLLSLLKKGIPYSSKTPDKFLTPKEEALQNYLLNKQQKMKAQEEQQNKLREIEFIEWYNHLSEEQINSIVGDKVNTLIGSKIMKEKSIKGLLVQYYDSEIWPSKKKTNN